MSNGHDERKTPSLLRRRQVKMVHQRAADAMGRLQQAANRSLRKLAVKTGRMSADDLEEEVERATGRSTESAREGIARGGEPVGSR